MTWEKYGTQACLQGGGLGTRLPVAETGSLEGEQVWRELVGNSDFEHVVSVGMLTGSG